MDLESDPFERVSKRLLSSSLPIKSVPRFMVRPRHRTYGSGTTGPMELTPMIESRPKIGGPGTTYRPGLTPTTISRPKIGGPGSVAPEYRNQGATYKPTVGENVSTIGTGRCGRGNIDDKDDWYRAGQKIKGWFGGNRRGGMRNPFWSQQDSDNQKKMWDDEKMPPGLFVPMRGLGRCGRGSDSPYSNWGEHERETTGSYGPMRVRTGQGRRKSQWDHHVARCRAENPGMSFSECLKVASQSY